MRSNQLSRRTFLKSVVLGVGAAHLPAMPNAQLSNFQTWGQTDLSFDVLTMTFATLPEPSHTLVKDASSERYSVAAPSLP